MIKSLRSTSFNVTLFSFTLTDFIRLFSSTAANEFELISRCYRSIKLVTIINIYGTEDVRREDRTKKVNYDATIQIVLVFRLLYKEKHNRKVETISNVELSIERIL